MTDRTKQPELKKIDSLDIIEPEVSILDNGIPVYIFNAGTIEITKLDFIFDAGTRFQQHPLIASYANKMLTEGTSNFTSYEIAHKLDYYGAWLCKNSTKDIAVVSLSVLNKHLKYLLPVLNEIINLPKFPESELKIHTHKDKQAFIDDCRKVNEVASMNFNRQLFGNKHSYGTLVGVEDFDKLQSQLLSGFHSDRYRPEYCKIVASGKLNKDLVKQLNCFFGQTKNQRNNIKEYPVPKIISGKPKQFIAMPDAVQSAVRIGKLSINKAHEDYIKLFILSTIFGGYFGSRLMKNIREDKGYTYGIYSMLLSYQQSAAFIIASEVGAGVCSKAIDEIYKELKILNSEPVSEQELDLVKKYLTGSIIRSFDGPFQISERFKSLLEYGKDYKKYYSEFLQTINMICPEDLLGISKKYLDVNSMHELVVGGK